MSRQLHELGQCAAKVHVSGASKRCTESRVLYSRFCKHHSHAGKGPETGSLYAEIERLKRRETDLLEANNRYLERARKAEQVNGELLKSFSELAELFERQTGEKMVGTDWYQRAIFPHKAPQS